jgi:integrase
MIPLNPANRSTPPGLSHSTVSAPDVTDVQRLITATETSQPIVAAAIALAAVTGARRGELCALWWSAVLPEVHAKDLVEPLRYYRPRPNPGPIADDPDRWREAAGATLAVHQEPDRLPKGLPTGTRGAAGGRDRRCRGARADRHSRRSGRTVWAARHGWAAPLGASHCAALRRS